MTPASLKVEQQATGAPRKQGSRTACLVEGMSRLCVMAPIVAPAAFALSIKCIVVMAHTGGTSNLWQTQGTSFSLAHTGHRP